MRKMGLELLEESEKSTIKMSYIILYKLVNVIEVSYNSPITKNKSEEGATKIS